MDSAHFIAFRDERRALACYDDPVLTFGPWVHLLPQGRIQPAILTRSGSLVRVALSAGRSHTCSSQVSVSADAGIFSETLPPRQGSVFAAPAASASGPRPHIGSGFS